MIAVKVIAPFKYSPDGISVVEVEKGKAELPEAFVEIAVAEGWIEPPKKAGKSFRDPVDPPASDPPPTGGNGE